jgi:hypothetical protein
VEEPGIVLDLRRVCAELRTGWTAEGWGNVLHLDGCTLRVNPAGMRPSWLQVSVVRDRDRHKYGGTVAFFRELDHNGLVRDERGRVTHTFTAPGLWLRSSIREALAFIDAQAALPPPPPRTIADILFDD